MWVEQAVPLLLAVEVVMLMTTVLIMMNVPPHQGACNPPYDGYVPYNYGLPYFVAADTPCDYT